MSVHSMWLQQPYAAQKMSCAACIAFLTSSVLAAPSALDTTIYADNQEDTYYRCLQAADTNPEIGLEMARRWIRLKGREPAQHCEALSLMSLGDAEEAALRMQSLASQSASNRSIRSGLWAHAGRAWMQVNDYSRALSAFTSALVLDDRDRGVYMDRALCHAALDDLWSAIDDLNRVIDSDPESLDALVLRGSAYRRLKLPDLAYDDLNRVLMGDPNYVDALLELGLLAENRGEKESARAAWIKVLELEPESAAGNAVREHIERIDLNLGLIDNKEKPKP